MINLLLNKIEIIVQENANGISEYDLISELRSDDEIKLDMTNLQEPHQLFQIHFLVQHCLYILRDRWLAEESGCLQITPVKVSLLPYSKSMREALAETDELRRYYLNLDHLKDTDAEMAEDLLTKFWVKYAASADKLEALAVFGLDEGAGFEEIKIRYRQLALRNHPDKGGSSEQFSIINQAMDTLNRYYK